MKVLICGAGRATRALLKRMGAGWDATVVDNGFETNEFIQEFASVSRVFSGDASSPVVLKRAGLAEHGWVLALTSDDEVNLAVVQAAVESGVKHVVARCVFPENKAAMEEAGARTFSGIAVMAAEIVQYLRNPRVRVLPVARGRGEVLEVEVAPRSAMAGSTLKSLSSPEWHVAAVFRGQRMLLQKPELVVLEGDTLIVVAEPDRYEAVCEFMQCGQMDFPQVYGNSILVALPGTEEQQRGVLGEALHLAQGTMVETVTLVADEGSQPVKDGLAMWSGSLKIRLVPLESRPYVQIETLSGSENAGVAVVPWTEPSLLKSLTRRTPLKLAHALDCPLLVAKASQPYKKILVPFTGSKTTESALDIALQMGGRFGATVTVVLVREPDFLHGVQDDWVPGAIATAREVAQARNMVLGEEIREGNPVLETVDLARDYNLIVLGSGDMDGVGFLNPDVGGHIVDKSPCSVLVVTS
ncbi:MAG: NAD-binding protein [Proteobacteria bacterium]|nr:NAD-binding protein [Pseudomonadota bacterium]